MINGDQSNVSVFSMVILRIFVGFMWDMGAVGVEAGVG